jgi:hypothetical protein
MANLEGMIQSCDELIMEMVDEYGLNRMGENNDDEADEEDDDDRRPLSTTCCSRGDHHQGRGRPYGDGS